MHIRVPVRIAMAALCLFAAVAAAQPAPQNRVDAPKLQTDKHTADDLRIKLPDEPPAESLIMRRSVDAYRKWWREPVNDHQAAWIKDAKGKAQQNAGGKPTNFRESTQHSSVAQASALVWLMEEDQAMLDKAVDALKHLAVVGADTTVYPDVMTNYLVAYDFIRGAKVNEADRKLIDANLREAAKGLHDWEDGKEYPIKAKDRVRNILLKRAYARMLAGLELHDVDMLNAGMATLVSVANAAWSANEYDTDSPTHYANYLLIQLAPMMRAYEGMTGEAFSPEPFARTTLGLRMPDGYLPKIQDGTHSFVGVHMISGTRSIHDEELEANLHWMLNAVPVDYNWGQRTNLKNTDWTMQRFFWASSFHVPAKAPTRSPTWFSRDESGLAVFRNDWSADSDYMLMSAGYDGSDVTWSAYPKPHDSFAHEDTGEIVLFTHGETVLVSPGYHRPDLPNAPEGFDSRRAGEHNIMLVDGKQPTAKRPAVALNRPVSETARVIEINLTDMQIEAGPPHETRTIDLTQELERRIAASSPLFILDGREREGFVGALDFAGLEYDINGAEAKRFTMHVGGDYFVVADLVSDDEPHDYAVNFVGRGKLDLLSPHELVHQARWQVGKAQVRANFLCDRTLTMSRDETAMHEAYNIFETTQRVRATTRSKAAAFLTVLGTSAAGDDARLVVTQVNSDTFAVQVEDKAAGWTDTMLLQHAPAPTTAGPLGSDAMFATLRLTQGRPTAAGMVWGTILSLKGTPMLKTDKPVTISATFDAKQIGITFSPSGFEPGTKLLITSRAKKAVLNGTPIPITEGIVELPEPGVLVLSPDE